MFEARNTHKEVNKKVINISEFFFEHYYDKLGWDLLRVMDFYFIVVA